MVVSIFRFRDQNSHVIKFEALKGVRATNGAHSLPIHKQATKPPKNSNMPKRRRGGTPAAKRAEPKTAADAAVVEKGASEPHAKSSGSKRKAAVRKTTGGNTKQRAAAAVGAKRRATATATDDIVPGASAVSDQATDGGDMPAVVADAGTSSSSPSDEQLQQNLQTLQRLDDEYIALDAMETILRRDLQRLQQDEQRIRLAMKLSSESPAERREREARERDQKALKRLESALMDEDEDGEEGNADGESNVDHGMSDNNISAKKNRSEDSTAEAEPKDGTDDGRDDDTLGGIISVSDLPAYI